MSLDPNAALLNNKARSNRQGSMAVTGAMKARQYQQQEQCKGRGRWQTERISQGRQGQANDQSSIGSPGKHRVTGYRENARNVSRGKTRLRNVCREMCCLYVGE